MSVRLSVRLLDFLFREGKLIKLHHIGMDRRRIYPDGFISWFELCPTNRPDAIGRTVDAIGEKPAKIAFFSSFSIKLRVLKGRYGLDILIRGKG